MCSPALPEQRPAAAWLDRLGMATSTLCAVHCAATALLMGALSAAGAGALGNPWVEGVFLTASVVLGAVSLGHAVTRHRSLRPMLWFAAGLVMLLVLRPLAPGAAGEVAAVAVGALCVVRAHWKNARLLAA
jgi:hypothetical protein